MKDKIIFYSTHCPKCKALEMKLKKSGVEYIESNDVGEMLSLGIQSAPALKLENGEILDFASAVAWVNTQLRD